MVLSNLLVGSKVKLAAGQVVSFEQLDGWLDVVSSRFAANAKRLATRFANQRATIDVAAQRRLRSESGTSSPVMDIPDLRGSFYQAELRRIPPMDREEEFRMAKRHEFLAELIRAGLVKTGIPVATAQELVRKPSRVVVDVLATRPATAHRKWLEVMVRQYEELRNLYVEGALYIVLGTVNRYRGLGVDSADLIQEGNASLFQAIDGFDWRRDVRFRTYAQYWVHQAVLKMLYNHSRTVRVPIWVQKLLGKIRRAQQEGRREGRELTPAEIGQKISVPAERVEWVLSTRRYAVSLDAEIGSEDGGTLAQALPDRDLVPIPESIPAGDLKAAIEEAMADLPLRERGILRRRFGLDGGEPQTLGEIAVDLGITAERVRQLQNAALGRIKRPAKLRRLQAFVE
jgi:RNA polymerase primary sigma factor